MDLKEVRELIKLVTEKNITEFELEREGFRLRIAKAAESAQPLIHSASATIPTPIVASHETLQITPQSSPPSDIPAVAAAPPEAELYIIKSPIVGTFYRSPSPTSDVFVKIGDQVENETVICIIEAMKLMNEIHAETVGEIAKIFVENGQPVEYGQPLFGIKN